MVSTVYDTFIKKCVRCPKENPVLLDGEFTCSACPSGTLFDQDLESCKDLKEFCHSNRVYNLDTKKCECPKDQPFFDGRSCVACYLPFYWSHDSKQCLECQVNHVYDTSLLKCVSCPSETPVTDSKRIKCISCPANYTFVEDQ